MRFKDSERMYIVQHTQHGHIILFLFSVCIQWWGPFIECHKWIKCLFYYPQMLISINANFIFVGEHTVGIRTKWAMNTHLPSFAHRDIQLNYLIQLIAVLIWLTTTIFVYLCVSSPYFISSERLKECVGLCSCVYILLCLCARDSQQSCSLSLSLHFVLLFSSI